MSEDRTQAPSKRRRDEARSRGMVARSPELTAAVGLLAAVALLGAWGGALASGLLDVIRAPFVASPSWDTDAIAVSASIRAVVVHVMMPLCGILGGVVVAMIAAHQAQVGGLWAPSLLSPDLARIWSPSGPDWGTRAARGVWGIAKTAIIVAVVAWSIRSEVATMTALSRMETPDLARSSGTILKGLAYTLGLALLALGLLDYYLALGRVEAMLRVTPDEHREDQKAIDGDPAVRSRRQSLARAWRSDPGEILTGAVVVVTGSSGLAVVLGGEGPPGKITVRGIARGTSGAVLKRSAERAGLIVVESPLLARHFAGASARTHALPEALGRELATIWPAS
ncbi:MAG: flagellar biosynthesis pathway, component FlhB [Planctomycetota bacterium]|nr:flagellar biosynthesis pathway, component FlhB [Planctomycetota bacterium]